MSDTPSIGLFLATVNPIATPEYVTAFARGAEERGFDSLWVGEHVLLFDEYGSKYPYSPDGKLIGLPPDSGMLDPFIALTWAAAATSRVRLATGVCLVPQRNPVYTAKEVATLDWLSGGRVTLGVGVGWLEEEFRGLGVPFAERGTRCREYLDVMKTLWQDPVSEHAGRFHTLPPTRQYPKPVQTPHPPILFGGESDAALRRVADVGQGWIGFDHTPETAAACIERLRKLLDERGRRLDELDLSVSPYLRETTGDDVPRYAEAGVTRIVLLRMAPTVDDIERTLDETAAEYLPA